MAQEAAHHRLPGAHRLGLQLIQRRGRRPLRGDDGRQFEPRQLRQFVRLLFIVDAAEQHTETGHGTPPETRDPETSVPLLSLIAPLADHGGNLSQRLCALTESAKSSEGREMEDKEARKRGNQGTIFPVFLISWLPY